MACQKKLGTRTKICTCLYTHRGGGFVWKQGPCFNPAELIIAFRMMIFNVQLPLFSKQKTAEMCISPLFDAKFSWSCCWYSISAHIPFRFPPRFKTTRPLVAISHRKMLMKSIPQIIGWIPIIWFGSFCRSPCLILTKQMSSENTLKTLNFIWLNLHENPQVVLVQSHFSLCGWLMLLRELEILQFIDGWWWMSLSNPHL